MKVNPMLLCDFYKTDHRRQYPEGTEYIYSNLTARHSRMKGVNKTLFFGLQYFIKEYLIKQWNEEFFNKPKDEVINSYKRRMDNSLGKDAISIEHIGKLHDLQYLPIKIKAVEEGTFVPIRCPYLTIINTIPEFYWLTNYIETLLSVVLWKPITSATTAYEYRKAFEQSVYETGYDALLIKWQGHDFSFRGMSGIEDAVLSSSGHLLSFTGTDTIPAIDFLEQYYNANCEDELIAGSVPATEHSVMSLSITHNSLDSQSKLIGEKNTIKRLITELYPNGVVSIVCDTFDFWSVINDILPYIKQDILNRSGKVVIRPDSGDPVDIICGIDAQDAIELTPQEKGAYECLWDIFGGNINDKGFKELDSHIGMIYGDSITLDRQKEILRRLKRKGFAPSNLVLGIGSFTYEYVTRDTFGMAMKATYGEVNGQGYEIYKDPKTDSGLKKSAKGLLSVVDIGDGLVCREQCSKDEEKEGLLSTVFLNGKLMRETSLNEIRHKVDSTCKSYCYQMNLVENCSYITDKYRKKLEKMLADGGW